MKIQIILFSLLSITIQCGLFLPAQKTDPNALAALLLLQPGSSFLSRPCAPYTASSPTGIYAADTVVSAPGSTGYGYDDSYCAVNGVRGLGLDNGSIDVYTMPATGSSAYMTLRWAGKRIVNGSGDDFIVYENPFQVSGSSSNIFLEALIVEVSADNAVWCGFGPNYTFAPETTFSSNPANWLNFAGLKPALYHQELNFLNAANTFTPSQGGGDFFDLANIVTDAGCTAGIANNIKDTNSLNAARGFLYLRLTAATARTNADSGQPFPQNSNAAGGGPDIDGVMARYSAVE